MAAPVIQFDYDFSPYGQKTKLLLTAVGAAYKKKDEPPALPRPDLEELGITYRRIPLLAIGKDVYADSSLIIDTIQAQLGTAVATSPADSAYEEWSNTLFGDILALIPHEKLTPEFLKDREHIFPFLLRPDIKTLRPSSLAVFRARLQQVENQFLSHSSSGPFIAGEKISVADIHIIWPIKCALESFGVGKEAGFGKEDFPKTYRLLESLPKFAPEVLSAQETQKTIREAAYTSPGPKEVAKNDPLGISAGTLVSVESFDSTPGSFPQKGKLVASDDKQVVIEIKDGIHLHFPRIGYIVRAQ